MPTATHRLESAEAQTIAQLLNQLERQGYDLEDRALVHRAYEAIVPLCTCQFKSSGRSMIDHVVSTASLMAAIAPPAPLVAATVLHAVYLHGDFGTFFRRIDEHKRARVREVVGETVEDIVYRYHVFRWMRATIPGIRDRLPRLGAADRNAILVRLFDQLELFGSRDTLFAHNAEKRQEFARDFGPTIASMADTLGVAGLSTALERAFAGVRDGRLPAALTVPAWREGVFMPPSYRVRPHVALYQNVRSRLWALTGR